MKAILKSAVIQLINLWREYLSNEYLLHVKYTHYKENTEDSLLIDHYLLGDVDWKIFDKTRWHKQNTFHNGATIKDVEKLVENKSFFDTQNKNSKGYEKDRIDLIFLSDDLIYAFHFSTNQPQIVMDLSSAIFGKGTFYGYIKAIYENDIWLLSSSYDRAKIYNGYNGALAECASYIFEQENRMTHPYQCMIDNYSDVYKNATKVKRKFL